MKARKVHKRRCALILTVLAAQRNQGPRQAHEDLGAGDEYFYNNALRIMVSEDFRYKIQTICLML
jgi:hypothetical protein